MGVAPLFCVCVIVDVGGVSCDGCVASSDSILEDYMTNEPSFSQVSPGKSFDPGAPAPDIYQSRTNQASVRSPEFRPALLNGAPPHQYIVRVGG